MSVSLDWETFVTIETLGDDALEDVERVKRMIAGLPAREQLRVNVVADILRELLESEDGAQVELAFTLVMAELAAR